MGYNLFKGNVNTTKYFKISFGKTEILANAPFCYGLDYGILTIKKKPLNSVLLSLTEIRQQKDVFILR